MCSVTAKFPGYVSRQTTVVLSQWKATTLDFVLEPLQSKDALQEIDCADQELAYHCAQPRLVSRVQSSLLDKGIRPWLSRKLVTSSDHPDMVSAVHMELFLVVSAGTVVVLVAGVLFLLARRRRALKGQPVRYLLKKP